MKFLLNFFCLLLCVNISLSELLCPQKKEENKESKDTKGGKESKGEKAKK